MSSLAHRDHITKGHVHVCTECDLVSRVPGLARGERARCPRCGHTLAKHMHQRYSAPFAYAVSAVVMALISLYFPFISFSSSGISKEMMLPEAITIPYQVGYAFLSYFYLLGVLVLPLAYLGIVIYLHVGVWSHRPVLGGRFLTKSLKYMHHWVMADIFVVGALVSLVKIMSLASIGFGIAFIPFCMYALLILGTSQSIDFDSLFIHYCGPLLKPLPETGEIGLTQGFTGCKACGQPCRIEESGKSHCPRCGTSVHGRTPFSVQITLALLITSIVLYIPGMTLPVMNMTTIGSTEPQSIPGGVLYLLSTGDIPVAVVIFLASVTIPVAKVVALLWLCRKVKQPWPQRLKARMRLYRIVEIVGRWSMIDVFVVTILTTMVQLGEIMSVTPGPGIIAFALVVILTMIAAMSFDPRLLWDAVDQNATDANNRSCDATISQSALGQDLSQ